MLTPCWVGCALIPRSQPATQKCVITAVTPLDSEIVFLGIHCKKRVRYVHKNICTWLIFMVLFRTANLQIVSVFKNRPMFFIKFEKIWKLFSRIVFHHFLFSFSGIPIMNILVYLVVLYTSMRPGLSFYIYFLFCSSNWI